MNQLRFVAFLLSFSTLLWLSALGQTSQTPTTPAAPPAGVTTQSSPLPNATPDTSSMPSAQSTGVATWPRFKLVPPRQDRPAVRKHLPDGPLVPGVTVQRLADRDQQGVTPPERSIDPGIYPSKVAGLGGVCGSIVSYNFSPGENPQLESVTTCTPSGTVATRRAEGQGKKTPTPQIQKTVLRQPQ